MSMQFQDLVIPMLVAGMIGVLGGGVLSGWWLGRRRGASRADAKSTRWAETTPASARLKARDTGSVAPRWPWRWRKAPPPVADLLVVDDSAVARVKLRRLFEAAGYDVHVAHDGIEAMALLQAGRYALMLTDLEMPNMDGATLIDRCRRLSHNAHLPILAITGHENLRLKFNECRDISGVHRKPWVDDILLSHVAALAGTRQGPAWRAPHGSRSHEVFAPGEPSAKHTVRLVAH